MKKFSISLLAGVCLLSGCAGMNSDFDCNAKAQDRCMTMEQANDQARQGTGGQADNATVKPVAESLPRLAPVPVSPSPLTGIQAASHNTELSRTAASSYGKTRLLHPSFSQSAPRVLPAEQKAGAQRYADTGMSPAVRVSPTTARLWIAGWIDRDDVLHQPSVVSFVAAPDHWAGS